MLTLFVLSTTPLSSWLRLVSWQRQPNWHAYNMTFFFAIGRMEVTKDVFDISIRTSVEWRIQFRNWNETARVVWPTHHPIKQVTCPKASLVNQQNSYRSAMFWCNVQTLEKIVTVERLWRMIFKHNLLVICCDGWDWRVFRTSKGTDFIFLR